MTRLYHIIVAAGSGSRFGAALPKQYCDLCGEPVVIHAVRALQASGEGARVAVVLHPDFRQHFLEECRRCGVTGVETVDGGATRWESVRNAVSRLRPGEADIITVHDGARPLVTPALVSRLVEAALANPSGAIPVTPVVESLRVVDDNGGNIPVDRSRFRSVQTPQAFRADLLAEAYRLPYRTDFTDDASVMAAAGHINPTLVDGDPRNIKITLPDDLAVAQLYMNR